MSAFKILKTICILITTSFAIFPFFFTFLPSVNTKMIVAALGVVTMIYNKIIGKNDFLDHNFLMVTLAALFVCGASFVSMVLNDTNDGTYLSFVVSMWVWLAAAYFCVNLMTDENYNVDAKTVIEYLVGVALMQCVLALLIYKFGYIRSFITSYLSGEKYMGVGIGTTRLFGPGCALDVGGARLGAILIMLSYLITRFIKEKKSVLIILGSICAFIMIFVEGNMMGRTTTVGGVLAIALFILYIIFDKDIRTEYTTNYLIPSVLTIFIGVFICIILYNFNEDARSLLRFGFEGFFNYFEKGSFETHSTDLLQRGLIFPDNLHTWIIGDGYMAGTANDPYYIGPKDYGFYMNTDAGYSRFIFYFGVLGLATLIGFFIIVTNICIKKSPDAKLLFIFLLLLNLSVWIKVSTDLFVMFAPFLCIPQKDQEQAEELEKLEYE